MTEMSRLISLRSLHLQHHGSSWHSLPIMFLLQNSINNLDLFVFVPLQVIMCMAWDLPSC